MPELNSVKRRQILSGLMKLLVFIGLIFISIPFISSFSSNSIDEKQKATSHWVITIPVSDLVEGEIKPLSWSGGLVWVYTRTANDILSLKQISSSLRDVSSAKSDQPDEMKNNFRSANETFFVFIPQENKRQCQVRLNSSSENSLFSEPCFNAKYDAAGRIFEKSGHTDQKNLAVPNHVVEDGILKIGVWTAKVNE